jgi:hypothetical protein
MPSDRLTIVALIPLAICGAFAVAGPSAAQAAAPGAASITAATELRVTPAPDGRVLASMYAGAPVQTLGTRGLWTQVLVQGWLHVSVIGAKRDSFPISVKAPTGALMRASADRNAATSALLEDGMGLAELNRIPQWVHVRRSGWVLAKLVRAGAPPLTAQQSATKAPVSAASDPGAAQQIADVDTSTPLPGDVAAAHRTAIMSAPTGRSLATVDSATRLTTGVSERGWVRVTLEGWVHEKDLIPLDSAPISAISAADLRSDPDHYHGQTVRWVVQVIAFQTADPLRKGLAVDEPYLLARGPGAENALLYLALPAAMVESAKALAPLSSIVVIARVRVGRSEPSGVPILDVQRIIRR